MSRYRERNRAVWAAPRHHARWGGDGPAVVQATGDRLLINGSGDRLLINGSGDYLRIN